MKNEHIAHLLPEYLEGFLDKNQRSKVERHLETCSICTKELEEYVMLLNAFDSEMGKTPANILSERFHELLEAEKQLPNALYQTKAVKANNRAHWLPQILKVAAGLFLLISGYLFGSYHKSMESNKEISVLMDKNMGIRQTAMLSLMENRSASKRIQGVNYVESFDRPNNDILKALTDRMLNDENANVRLTAVNALAGFTTSKTVRGALIKALKSEKDPNIQIAVIHTLVKIKEKSAVTPMRQLLDQKNTEPFVKEQIRALIPSII